MSRSDLAAQRSVQIWPLSSMWSQASQAIEVYKIHHVLPGVDIPSGASTAAKSPRRLRVFLYLVAVSLAGLLLVTRGYRRGSSLAPFYASVHYHDDVCPGGASSSGYIGLKGDTEDDHRRSFFWLFKAQNDWENAPVVLTIGGGPGSSGLGNPLLGQSHCVITSNATTARNPNAWSEHVNLLALDHPVGAGFSYGKRVYNSRAAAHDVYDFLTKFFHLYPELARNNLTLASGSYGGTYIPHIATVIHEGNLALASGTPFIRGAKYINLESMMVSNPLSDALSHYRWVLQQNCIYTDYFNATLCHSGYAQLPECLERVQFAYENGSARARSEAGEMCDKALRVPVAGRSQENVELYCDGTLPGCVPQVGWIDAFLNNPSTKRKLGVRPDAQWHFESDDIAFGFIREGDLVQQAYLLYTPLLETGIRLLHYIGKLDLNCAWPGVLSMLKLLPSPYQHEFIEAPDVRWAGENATVRAVGDGKMVYLLMDRAGHWVTKDDPVLVKKIVDRWVFNIPLE